MINSRGFGALWGISGDDSTDFLGKFHTDLTGFLSKLSFNNILNHEFY
jgi:hypothetical protein